MKYSSAACPVARTIVPLTRVVRSLSVTTTFDTSPDADLDGRVSHVVAIDDNRLRGPGSVQARMGMTRQPSPWPSILAPLRTGRLCQGIKTSQAGEPHEIRVVRVKSGVVLNSQHRDLRVRHQISRRAELLQ